MLHHPREGRGVEIPNEIVITVSANDKASKVFVDVDKHARGLGSSLSSVSKIAAGFVLGRGLIALPGALGAAAKAAADDAASMARLRQAVINTGTSYQQYSGQLDAVIKKGQQLGFTDDQTRDSLSLLTAQTDDVGEAMRRYAIAQDLARGANLDVVTASRLLGKVTEENVNVLARYGIKVRQGASETELFAAVQQKFSGQAATFADTAAGKMARFNDAVSEAKERIGGALVPALTRAAEAGLKMFDVFDKVSSLLGGGGKVSLMSYEEALAKADATNDKLAKSIYIKVAAALKQEADNAKVATKETDLFGDKLKEVSQVAAGFNSKLRDANAALQGFGRVPTQELANLENEMAKIDAVTASLLAKGAAWTQANSDNLRSIDLQSQSLGTQVQRLQDLNAADERRIAVLQQQKELAGANVAAIDLEIEALNKSQAARSINVSSIEASITALERQRDIKSSMSPQDEAELERLKRLRDSYSAQRDVLLANRDATIATANAKVAAGLAAQGLLKPETALKPAILEAAAALSGQTKAAEAGIGPLGAFVEATTPLPKLMENAAHWAPNLARGLDSVGDEAGQAAFNVQRLNERLQRFLEKNPSGLLSQFTKGALNSSSGKASGGPASGWTVVGEQGAELVKLPGGSQVYSHEQSRQMVQGGGRGDVNVNILGPVTIQNVGGQQDVQQTISTIGYQMAWQVRSRGGMLV